MKTLLKCKCIVTLDENSSVLRDSDILIEGGIIKEIGKNLNAEGCSIIDLSSHTVMPGLVNAHTHSPMVIFRSLADDCPLDQWLNRHIWPAEKEINNDDVRISALYSIIEMLRYGITSFSDMYRHSTVIAEAVSTTGIKATIADSITCNPDEKPEDLCSVKECIDLIRSWNNYGDGLLKTDTSIQSPWQTTPALWECIARIAEEYGIGIHMHLAETEKEVDDFINRYGKSPLVMFEKAGVLQSRISAAHCSFLTDEDLDAASRAHSFHAIHDPASNMKMCSGLANLKRLAERGTNIAVGTDGVCSSNSYDIFETLKLTSLVQKSITDNPSFLPAMDLLKMATANGLKAQGRKEKGMIAPGQEADIIAISNDTGMVPDFNPAANLIYSCNASHVTMTMVRGKILYRDGEYMTIDKEMVRDEFIRRARRFRSFAL